MISSKFSEEKNEEYKKILCEGSSTIKLLSNKEGVSQKKFRLKFFQGKYPSIDPELAGHIRAVHRIQEDIILSYSAFLNKQVHNFFSTRVFVDSAIDQDDFVSEAYLGFIDAIYSYKGHVKFITYAWTTTTNHLCNFVNHSGGVISRSPKTKELIRKYKELGGENMPFNKIVELLNLGPKDRKRLDRALNFRVFNETSISFGNRQNEDEGNKPKAGFLNTVIDFREVIDEDVKILQQVLDSIKLSEMESDVLHTYLTHGKGWYDVVRSKYTSQITGRPYSHQAIYIILERVIKKIKSKCKVLAA